MLKQCIKAVCVFLLIVVVAVVAVWAVASFLDKHFGITLSLSPTGYFDAEDAGIQEEYSRRGSIAREDEAACGQLEPTARYMCGVSHKMTRLEGELRILRGRCGLPEGMETRIMYALSQ